MKKLLGVDAFVHTAQDGIEAGGVGVGGRGTRTRMGGRERRNPWSRGVWVNCTDFWSKHNGSGKRGWAVLGGQEVDYFTMYEVPRAGFGLAGPGDVELGVGPSRAYAYRGVPTVEGEVR